MAGTGRTIASDQTTRRSRARGGGASTAQAPTEDREAARARYEKSHLFAMAVEQVAESVMITDRLGIIHYVNPAFERISGYSWEDVLGKRASVLKSGKHDEAFYRSLWDTISRGDVWRGRITDKRKDGSLYEADMSISPVRDGAGAVIHYVSVKRDIREERRLEGQLLTAMTHNLAHDFNNITTAIIGFTELVIDEIPEGTKARRRLGYVRDAGLRARELVKEMLKFSGKTETGTGRADPGPPVKEKTTEPADKGGECLGDSRARTQGDGYRCLSA